MSYMEERIARLEAAIAYLAPDELGGVDIHEKAMEFARIAGHGDYPGDEDYANAVLFVIDQEDSKERMEWAKEEGRL